ncbi:MAG: hypothetical protein E7Z94_08120 [Actinomyces ruminicola]|nr:hypothetical protein [Actinomyces ruminicola]
MKNLTIGASSRVRNIVGGCVLGFVTALAMAIVVVVVPGLAAATGASSPRLVTIYVLLEGLRQSTVSCILLMMLRSRGGLWSRVYGVAHAIAYAAGTALLVLLFQLVVLRQTGMPMLVEAVALLAGSLMAAAVVRPNSGGNVPTLPGVKSYKG